MSEVIPCLISKDDGKGNFVKAKNARIEKVNQDCANTLACHESSLNVHHCNMVIVAMRGRNPNNPSDRTPGIELEQRLEPNSEGICNTLTTVQKDNLLLEETIIYDDYNSNIPKNQDCIGTLTTNIGSSTMRNGIKIIEKQTAGNSEIVKIEKNITDKYRIRKLTPRECFRLMNVEEEQFNRAEKVVSNSQLYKVAGNAIVVSVLCALFSQLGIQGKKKWNDMTESERIALVHKNTVMDRRV